MTEPLTLARRLRVRWEATDEPTAKKINRFILERKEAADRIEADAATIASLSDANKALTAKADEALADWSRAATSGIEDFKRAEAAEAKLAKVEAIEAELHETVRYLKTERDDAVRWRASAVACADRLEAKLAEARNALHPFDKYVPDTCFEGKGRYKLVETTEAGGGWLGAEDFRRVRSFLASKEASHGTE